MTANRFPFDSDVDWDKVAAASDFFCPLDEFRESLAELFQQLDAAGYAVVKLPEKEVHEDAVGGAIWRIPEISRWAHVFGRREDSRIAIDSVLKEFAEMESPEHALALGAALIAAARSVQEK